MRYYQEWLLKYRILTTSQFLSKQDPRLELDQSIHKILLDLIKNPNYNRYKEDYMEIDQNCMVGKMWSFYFLDVPPDYHVQFLKQGFPDSKFFSVSVARPRSLVCYYGEDYWCQWQTFSEEEFKKEVLENVKGKVLYILQTSTRLLEFMDVRKAIFYDYKRETLPYLKNGTTIQLSKEDTNSPLVINLLVQKINAIICDNPQKTGLNE